MGVALAGGAWRGMRTVLLAAAVGFLPTQGVLAQREEQGPSPTVSAIVTQTSTDKAGYETYRVGVMFGPTAADVYALYGQKGSPLIMPPAYQVAGPFGSSVGPVSEAFVSVHPESAFDSWLTIGVDGPALIPNALSSVGLQLGDWSETQGINADNGAVFFMDPAHGATVEPVVFAQLTVRAGTSFSGQVSAQGRSTGDNPDWDVTALAFSHSPADAAGAAGAAEALLPPAMEGPMGAKEFPPPPPPHLGEMQMAGMRPAGGTGGSLEYTGEHHDENVHDVEADCTVRGLSLVSNQCPPAAAGSAVPSSCPRVCAATVNSWYRACIATRAGAASVQRLDHMLSGDLMKLVDLCAPAGDGGH